MRILITGGAGFIGSHLAERLKSQGHQVDILDRKHFGGLSHGWCFDCRYILNLPYLVNGGSWDFIYHLAASVGVNNVLENPKECIENNIESLRSVLSLGIPGLFTSTSEVYGRNESILSEDSPLVYSSKTRWSYAASKLIGEFLAKQAGWKTVRLFNVVGPRQNAHYGAVLPNFVKQALAQEPMTVYGDGKQIRTFMDVHDTVECLDKLRDKEFDVVNIGGSHITSIDDLAMLVGSEVSKLLPPPRKFRVCYQDYKHAYPEGFEECPSRIPDLTKLDSLLPERAHTYIEKTISDLAKELQNVSTPVCQ